MGNFLAMIWDFTPQVFSFSEFPVWYGVLFAGGFMVSYMIMKRIFKREGVPVDLLDKLLIYIMVGTVVGARLGHVFFYEWSEYSKNPIDIIKIWEGGLASHGGVIGVSLAIWMFYRKYKSQVKLRWVFDRVVIGVALTACFIRFGNLTNSEILGEPTNSSYGVYFANNTTTQFQYILGADRLEVDYAFDDSEVIEDENGIKYPKVRARVILPEGIDKQKAFAAIQNASTNKSGGLFSTSQSSVYALNPNEVVVAGTDEEGRAYVDTHFYGTVQYPAQLFEAIAYLALFILLIVLYYKTPIVQYHWMLLGVFLVVQFTARFFIEYVKMGQAARDAEMSINTGQILSIPCILAGLILIGLAFKNGKRDDKTATPLPDSNN